MRYRFNPKYYIPVFWVAVLVWFFQLDDKVREDFLWWESYSAQILEIKEGNTFVGNLNNARCIYEVSYIFQQKEYFTEVWSRADCWSKEFLDILINPDNPEEVVEKG